MNQAYEIQLSIGQRTRDNAIVSRPTALAVVEATLAPFGVDGYTVLDGRGYWKGKSEPCLLVSWVVDRDVFHSGTATRIAKFIAEALHQECVLVTCRKVLYEFVAPGDVE